MTHSPARAAAPLPAAVRSFLADGLKFASIATVDGDGAPRTAVIWYQLDGDTLVINSLDGRRWPNNLRRDPRVALSITDPADGYRWIGLTGRAEIIDDPVRALADISAMARRYHADDPAKAEAMIENRFGKQRRVSFRITVDGVHEHLED